MKYTWTTRLRNLQIDSDTQEVIDLDEEQIGEITPIYEGATVHAHKMPNTSDEMVNHNMADIPTYEFINIKKTRYRHT